MQMRQNDAVLTVPDVVLISTHALDRVPSTTGMREIPGGPAMYVAGALRRLGRGCRVLTGEQATVDVMLGPQGEQYVVQPLPLIPLPLAIAAPAIVLSPIMREIDPYRLPELHGLVVVDLQGFVRQPGQPSGMPGHNVDLLPLAQRADIVKATDRELGALSEASRAALHDAIVVLTRGIHGASVLIRSREIAIPSRPIVAASTIGAGDTFVAAVTAATLEGASPAEAAERAARFTEAFLAAKH